MPLQHELFQQKLEIHPPTDSVGPRLWVRRIVVWREPGGEKIRDVSLRPGLNIIWTPDDRGIGHGGGKTLFCRLVRYCLGEDRFSPDDQRTQISANFPDGLIGAEVILDGVCWAIIRPLGIRRRHLAVPDGNLDELAATDSSSTGLEPFLDAVEKAFFPTELASLIPGHRQDRRGWPIALALLTRDQECRFDHVLDWRSATSESDSPARGLNQTEKLDSLRVFLQAITPEEQRKRDGVAKLEESRKASEAEIGHRQWQIDQLKTKVFPALGLRENILTDGAFVKDLLLQAVETSRNNRGQRDADGDAAAIEVAKKDYEEARAQVVALEQQIGILTSDIPNIQRIVAKIEGEYPGLTYAVQEAQSYPCPICEVPIDRVLASKCNLSHKIPDLESCKQRLATNRKELTEETERLTTAKRSRSSAQQALIEAKQHARTLQDRLVELEASRDSRNSAWNSAMQLSNDVSVLIDLMDKQSEAAQNSANQTATIEDEREIIASFVDRQTPVFTRLTEKFDPIIRYLIGPEATGNIALTGKGLSLTVRMGGNRSTSAIDSLKVIAFDLSTLCLAIEGTANLPSFLVHDSPREADLGLEIYHRLFLFARSLEGVGNQPLFQYIVTTTTPPPHEVKEEPCLRLTLHGTPAQARFLSIDL